MRKLVIFCFAVCMTVLTVLSLLNFAQDAEESMILDKRAVILEKPETLSNREFLGQILPYSHSPSVQSVAGNG